MVFSTQRAALILALSLASAGALAASAGPDGEPSLRPASDAVAPRGGTRVTGERTTRVLMPLEVRQEVVAATERLEVRAPGAAHPLGQGLQHRRLGQRPVDEAGVPGMQLTATVFSGPGEGFGDEAVELGAAGKALRIHGLSGCVQPSSVH